MLVFFVVVFLMKFLLSCLDKNHFLVNFLMINVRLWSHIPVTRLKSIDWMYVDYFCNDWVIPVRSWFIWVRVEFLSIILLDMSGHKPHGINQQQGKTSF